MMALPETAVMVGSSEAALRLDFFGDRGYGMISGSCLRFLVAVDGLGVSGLLFNASICLLASTSSLCTLARASQLRSYSERQKEERSRCRSLDLDCGIRRDGVT
jgi:hypothetical protein